MYVYQVTNLSTGEFYIGLSEDSRRTFDPVKRIDPMQMFNVKVSNGTGTMPGCEKRFLAEASDHAELSQLGAEYAKKFAPNPKFLGIKA